MEQLGILTELDMTVFAAYCESWARYQEAEEFITQHGTIVKTPSGYYQTVPQVAMVQQYLKIMNRLAEQLGMDLTTYLRMCMSRLVQENGVPFSMKLEEDKGAKAIAALKEASRIAQENGIADMSVHDTNNEICINYILNLKTSTLHKSYTKRHHP